MENVKMLKALCHTVCKCIAGFSGAVAAIIAVCGACFDLAAGLAGLVAFAGAAALFGALSVATEDDE